jgi:hypothetical protein
LLSVEGERHNERVRRMNMVFYYVLMYENGKVRLVETVPGIGGRGIKEHAGKGQLN